MFQSQKEALSPTPPEKNFPGSPVIYTEIHRPPWKRIFLGPRSPTPPRKEFSWVPGQEFSVVLGHRPPKDFEFSLGHFSLDSTWEWFLYPLIPYGLFCFDIIPAKWAVTQAFMGMQMTYCPPIGQQGIYGVDKLPGPAVIATPRQYFQQNTTSLLE